MYESIDHMLHQVFHIINTLIIGESNIARIEEWIKTRGVVDRCESGLSQHDYHANSVIILSRAKLILNDVEWSLLNAHYGNDLSGIVDLTNFITSNTSGLTMLECDALLEHLFLPKDLHKQRKMRQIDIQDRFNWSKGQLFRKMTKVRKQVNKLYNDCITKLEIDMEELLSK